jgi:endoglucanase
MWLFERGYDGASFTLDNNSQITQWGFIATNASRKSTWGREDFMDSQLAAMYNKFVTQGYPVVIGEYCVTNGYIHAMVKVKKEL